MSDQYISKRQWAYNGRPVDVGEVISPTGSSNDARLFGDNTHWVSRHQPIVGAEPIECTSDGCGRLFANLGALQRHQRIVHAPEREDRLRFRREHREMLEAREERGETIGGYDVVKNVKDARGNKVPYVKLT